MDLTQAMHAATQDPPPTAIDVDQLITGERRRARRLHTVTGVAFAAVLVAGAATVPSLLARTPSGQSPGLAPPSTVAASAPPAAVGACPTVTATVGATGETCEAAHARLIQVLADALRRVLPDAPGPLILGPNGEGYDAFKQLPGSDAVLVVQIRPTGVGTVSDVDAFATKMCGATCRKEPRLGAMVLVRSATDVWAIRTEGTAVNATTRGTTSITEQQLIEIALTPGLTLRP